MAQTSNSFADVQALSPADLLLLIAPACFDTPMEAPAKAALFCGETEPRRNRAASRAASFTS